MFLNFRRAYNFLRHHTNVHVLRLRRTLSDPSNLKTCHHLCHCVELVPELHETLDINETLCIYGLRRTRSDPMAHIDIPYPQLSLQHDLDQML